MKNNEHDESKKMIVGVLIGSIMGASALYCLRAAQHQKTPALKKIGRTISEIGDFIEHSDLGNQGGLLDSIEKTLPKSAAIVSNMIDWVDSGMTLLKKFKKG